MDLSSFIGLWSESKMISGGKTCLNWLAEASGGTEGLHRVLLHKQAKTSNTGVFVFKRVNI